MQARGEGAPRPILGDGGIETALEDRLGQTLPEFAAFVLLDSEAGREALREYYRPFVELAAETGMRLMLDTPTWRANPDWVALVEGFEGVEGVEGLEAGAAGERALDARVAALSAAAVSLVRDCARVLPGATVNGVVGPRFDDYVADERMSPRSAAEYHAPQVRALAEAGADRVTAVTMLDAAEGIGVVRAAGIAGIPAVVSFTVGADGRLADGSTVAEAIREVDEATGAAALGFAVNCAHPDEVAAGLGRGEPELSRLLGFRLNAARAEAEDGGGDVPEAFAAAFARLAALAPAAELYGGCCGTDAPHIAALAEALDH